MATSVSVIVVKCVPSKGDERTYGNQLVNTAFPSLDRAQEVGNSYRKVGICVIVRPNYNEKDERCTFFREWRSFNGEEFKEVRFDYDPERIIHPTDSQIKTILDSLKTQLYSECERYFRGGEEGRKPIIDQIVSAIQVFEPDFNLTDWALSGASIGGKDKGSCYDDNETRDPDYYNRVRGG